jgi:hypothetical protein
MTNSTTVNIVGTPTNGQTGVWNSTTNQFEPGTPATGGGGTGLNVGPFTPPPVASQWNNLVISTGGEWDHPIAPTDIPGPAVSFDNDGVVGHGGIWTRTLSSPGGAHTILYYLDPNYVPAAAIAPISDNGFPGIAIVGTTKFVFLSIGAFGLSTPLTALAQRQIISTGAFDTNLQTINFSDAGGLGPAWWQITFDDTNLTVFRSPVGGVYSQPFGSIFAHGCGVIQKIGVTTRNGVAHCQVTLRSLSGNL